MALCSPPTVARLLAPRLSGDGSKCATDRWSLKSSFFNAASTSSLTAPSISRLTMRVASKKAYICQDCGYIYSERTPFSKLPDSYSCPVCLAPKRRFRPYDEPVARNANDTKARKARKEQMKQANSMIGSALPIGVAIVLVALLGAYLYLNSQF